MLVVDERGFKSFMDVTAITNTKSKQYKLLKRSKPNSDGTLMIDDRVCVAVGQYYGKVGDKITIKLSTGKFIKAIICDVKAKKHTVDNKVHKSDGSVLEFVVDSKKLPRMVAISGNLSNIERFSGKVVAIKNEQRVSV